MLLAVSGICRGRVLRRALTMALLTSLLLAAAAQATVTSSSITAPADPFFALDQQQAQLVTISGTSDGTTGDSVDVVCYSDNGSTGSSNGTVASGVAVNADGSFSTSVPLSQLEQSFPETCRLRAVASGGTSPTGGLASFAGPRTEVARLLLRTTGSATTDYYVLVPQLAGIAEYDSFGLAGLDNSYLMDPSIFGRITSQGYFFNDYADQQSASNANRAAALVDTKPAYAPAAAAQINPSATGLPSVSVSATQNSSTGDVTITESEPLVRCAGDPYPPTSGNCAAFVDSGVRLSRTVTQTDNGHMAFIEDAYSSTDGSSHGLDLLLQNQQYFTVFTGGTENPAVVSYEFPGQTAFATHNPGDQIGVPGSAPASILIENNQTPDGSISGVRGAITYGQVPSGPFAFGTASPDSFDAPVSTFDAPNIITVPASGSVPLRYAYSTEFSLAAAQADAQTAQSRFDQATVSITSPVNGATVTSSPVTVTGSVSSTSGAKSVSVNGVAAQVNGNAFSASVPLSQGSDTLTATLSTNSGATASASETITYVPVAPIAPIAKTGSATHVKPESSTLTGSVTPGSAPTTYQFEYGTSPAYGKLSSTGAPLASGPATSVSRPIAQLTPGTLYHYRLTATNAGGTSNGADLTFRTPRAALKRLTDSVAPRHDRHAPYVYRISGRLLIPSGVSGSKACKGHVSLVVRKGKHKVLSRRLKVNGRCRYGGKASFSARKLHGHGKLRFTLRFGGNAVLASRSGKAITVSFG
ncbi:MAG: hypothetical protein ACRDNK_06530 [Solirubrobacteraceae bacterium]